ncbi:hypothetical protein FACS1894184_09160 [Clostridia bacterium]|nr:hypothetical protein FACS1894184_09160 [Clostridia bacterium]
MIGDMMRINRLVNGYTQERFAALLDVSAGSIWRWERGKALPPLRICIRLASMLCISLDELVGFETSALCNTLTQLNIIRHDGSIDEARIDVLNTLLDVVIAGREKLTSTDVENCATRPLLKS